MKKMLYFEDLYNYFLKENRNVVFNYKKDNSVIIVNSKEKICMDNLSRVHLKTCHLFENANQTYISEESMKNAIPSIYNKPILGYIWKDDDGNYQFDGHNIEVDEDGELHYAEQIVGVFPESCNPNLVYDETNDKTYLEADGIIYDEYTKAKDILEREKELPVSVELEIRGLKYDAKTQIVEITDFIFNGCTILGINEITSEKVAPGMEGANIKLDDFNSYVSSLKNNLPTHNNNSADSLLNINSKKGGKPLDIEKLLKKYSLKKEDISDIEITDKMTYEELDELLKKKKKVVVDDDTVIETSSEDDTENNDTSTDDTENGDTSNDDTTTENSDTSTDDTTTENGGTSTDNNTTTEDNNTPTDDNVSTGDNDASNENNVPTEEEPTQYSRNLNFELSLNETEYVLDELIEKTYGSAYLREAYADYVIMYDYSLRKYYKQYYTITDDKPDFVGDRIEVFNIYVDKDEKEKLEEMRANYDSIYSELANYKDEPKKVEILNSVHYAILSDSVEFKDLCDISNHFDLSVEEVESKANEILLDYVKNNSAHFSNNMPNNIHSKHFVSNFSVDDEVGRGRYGDMFSE